VISGARGAGTIFFAGCHLRCVYCQNHQISQAVAARRRPRRGVVEMQPTAVGAARIEQWQLSVEALADRLLDLAADGAHNIEWVSPSTQLPAAVRALRLATERGLDLPLVYNSSGYESHETLRLLDGVVDVYLPDLKYVDPRIAGRLSAAPDYPTHALPALREMWRQVGPLQLDDAGLAWRGLLVRHLVLPGRWAQCDAVLGQIAAELGGGVAVSLMAQYHPEHRASALPDLDRPLRVDEYQAALDALERHQLWEGFVQELDAAECYRPDFERDDHPFEDRDAR